MRKVIGIGETVFDIIFKNNQPVSATPGGSTYNSMISIGRTGLPAEFISETGDDRVGRIIRNFLEENGVSAKNICIHRGQKSALSLAFLNDNNDAEYVFYKDHINDRLEFQFPEVHPNDVILFGSYYSINPVVRHQVKPFLEYAKDHGAILYYDINFRASHKHEASKLMDNIHENLSLSDIVRGSSEDCEVLYGLSTADEVFRKEIALFTRNFIYTAGSEPAELRAMGNISEQYPVKRVETVSTIGAGDSFNAGMAYGMIHYGVTKNNIQNGLPVDTWNKLFHCAQKFSMNVCQRWENYIDKDLVYRSQTE